MFPHLLGLWWRGLISGTCWRAATQVDMSEFAKVDGGVTCLSLRFWRGASADGRSARGEKDQPSMWYWRAARQLVAVPAQRVGGRLNAGWSASRDSVAEEWAQQQVRKLEFEEHSLWRLLLQLFVLYLCCPAMMFKPDFHLEIKQS